MGRGRTAKARKPGTCSTCRQPVRGHVGRPGKSCTNIRSEGYFISSVLHRDNSPQRDIYIGNPGEMATGRGNSHGNPEPEDTQSETLEEIRGISRGIQECVAIMGDQVRELRSEFEQLRAETRGGRPVTMRRTVSRYPLVRVSMVSIARVSSISMKQAPTEMTIPGHPPLHWSFTPHYEI